MSQMLIVVVKDYKALGVDGNDQSVYELYGTHKIIVLKGSGKMASQKMVKNINFLKR